MHTPKRVLVVEDDFLIAEKLRGMLEDEGHEVIGETASGREAVELTARLQPDVVLMDIQLAEMDGITAARQITDCCPAPIVALTAYETADLVARASEAGVGYYLVKPASSQEIARAITIALGRFDDMQELHRLNTRLQESEQRYALAQRVANIGSWDWDIRSGDLHWSERIEPLFGFGPGEFDGTYDAFLECVHPEDRQRVKDAVNACVEQDVDYDIEHRIVWPDGSVHWVSEIGDVIRDEQGEPIRMLGVVQDVTARKRAEEALQKSEHLLKEAQHVAHLGSWEMDVVTEECVWSDEFFRICGYEPQAFSPTVQKGMQIIHPDDRAAAAEAVRSALEDGTEYAIEKRIVRPDGSVRCVEARGEVICGAEGRPVRIVGSFLDITERKLAEFKLQEYAEVLEQMVEEKVRQLEQERAKAIQLDKMAALGEMATGVAHELNQPLTSITFEAHYLQELATKAQDEHTGDLNWVLDAAGLREIGENLEGDLARCRRLIRHLRDFGRISQEPPALVSLNRPIEESFILVGARLREHGVDVHLRLADDLPPVMADSYKLEQVFLNLINNAKYAMERRAEGDGDYHKVLEITTMLADGEVVATVRDNGCGMPEEVRARVFDPFFTTKPRGEGVGLGLSISYSIVSEFGGQIECQSAEGEGTTFTLRFPAAL
jgi:PAS domain S-box-containing protein